MSERKKHTETKYVGDLQVTLIAERFAGYPLLDT